MPGSIGFQVFDTGLHFNHTKKVCSNMAMFIDTTRNRTKAWSFPVVRRKIVIPKLDFDHRIARILNVAPISPPIRPMADIFSWGMSHGNLPNPRSMTFWHRLELVIKHA